MVTPTLPMREQLFSLPSSTDPIQQAPLIHGIIQFCILYDSVNILGTNEQLGGRMPML